MRASERSELAHDTVIVIEPGADYLVGFMWLLTEGYDSVCLKDWWNYAQLWVRLGDWDSVHQRIQGGVNCLDLLVSHLLLVWQCYGTVSWSVGLSRCSVLQWLFYSVPRADSVLRWPFKVVLKVLSLRPSEYHSMSIREHSESCTHCQMFLVPSCAFQSVSECFSVPGICQSVLQCAVGWLFFSALFGAVH